MLHFHIIGRQFIAFQILKPFCAPPYNLRYSKAPTANKYDDPGFQGNLESQFKELEYKITQDNQGHYTFIQGTCMGCTRTAPSYLPGLLANLLNHFRPCLMYSLPWNPLSNTSNNKYIALNCNSQDLSVHSPL